MYFLTPTFRPVGGVVKIFDYVNHAIKSGYKPVICCPYPFERDLPLFQIPRFSNLTPDHDLKFIPLERVTIGPHDLAYFSWPPHYQVLEERMSRWTAHEQVIHIVQNVRHSNPSFAQGYALRLLTRPMSRIMTNDVVLEATRPYLNESSLTSVINLGHEAGFFSGTRSDGLHSPIRVAYTTWKSKLGDQIAERVRRGSLGSKFEFAAVREHVSWQQLRELYQWADIFLATPNPEEGFYMPGLEAMEAGAIVVTPDVGGNMAYCEFGSNCIGVEFENPDNYEDALYSLQNHEVSTLHSLRQNAYKSISNFTLENERQGFVNFLKSLEQRLQITSYFSK